MKPEILLDVMYEDLVEILIDKECYVLT